MKLFRLGWPHSVIIWKLSRLKVPKGHNCRAIIHCLKIHDRPTKGLFGALYSKEGLKRESPLSNQPIAGLKDEIEKQFNSQFSLQKNFQLQIQSEEHQCNPVLESSHKLYEAQRILCD